LAAFMTDQQIESVFKENSVIIFRFLRLRTLSKEIAEDLTSETFLRFVSKKDLLSNSPPDSIRSFLFGIAKLVFLEYLRRKYRQEISISMEAPEFINYVESYVGANSELSNRTVALTKLIGQLPEKQRIVAALRLVDKKQLVEICQILNKDSNYVRTTQKRAIANLRRLWELECTQSDTGILELTQNE
jgi:RNA polymerase sigma-70 factor, ECF subfamily